MVHLPLAYAGSGKAAISAAGGLRAYLILSIYCRMDSLSPKCPIFGASAQRNVFEIFLFPFVELCYNGVYQTILSLAEVVHAFSS